MRKVYLDREHSDIQKRYLSKMDILELKKYPGLIFKKDHRGDRSKNRLKSLEIINKYNLDKLIIPNAIDLLIKVNGVEANILIEEKLELTGIFDETKSAYNALFSEMTTNPKLQEQLEVLFAQLAIFVYETGFWDVGYSNIPLLKNSDTPQIVLVDLNDIFEKDGREHQKEGIKGLLERFHKTFHKLIVNSAANHSGKNSKDIMMELDECDYYSTPVQCSYKHYSYDDVFLRYEKDGYM